MLIKDISCCGCYYCKKCAYYTGEITSLAENLLEYVKKYRSLAFFNKSDTFSYTELKVSLEWLSERELCKGCRSSGKGSWWPDCPIRKCILEKGIDFCFNCDLFPCDKIEKTTIKDRIIKANNYLATHKPKESYYDPILTLLKTM